MKPFPRRDCMPAAEREGWDLQIRPIALRMRGLVIFRGLLEDPVVARLLALHDEISHKLVSELVGSTVTVLVESHGRTEGCLNGRLDNNLVVEFAADPALLGQYARVTLTGARGAMLQGQLA